MTETEKWNYLIELDEKYLKGGVGLSEWCSFIVKESDIAFVNGANLATILTAVSGIETYLSSEQNEQKKINLVTLINEAFIDDDLKDNLHKLRKYRNKWVHVSESWNDEDILANPSKYEMELEKMAFFAIDVLRRTIYSNQFI